MSGELLRVGFIERNSVAAIAQERSECLTKCTSSALTPAGVNNGDAMVWPEELIHEEFGDGIMSAIDFNMRIEREPNLRATA